MRTLRQLQVEIRSLELLYCLDVMINEQPTFQVVEIGCSIVGGCCGLVLIALLHADDPILICQSGLSKICKTREKAADLWKMYLWLDFKQLIQAPPCELMLSFI